MPKKSKRPQEGRGKGSAPKKALQKAGSTNAIVEGMDDVGPIVAFLENFRQIADPRNGAPSKLISLKVPEPLLAAFRFKAEREGVPYQSMIKRLMVEWLRSP